MTLMFFYVLSGVIVFSPEVTGSSPNESALAYRFAVVERVRQFLPLDSVVVYFKLELVRTPYDSEDPMHEGVFGEFLFGAEKALSADAPATQSEERDDQPLRPPEIAIPGIR
ncbi:hypothetical protein MTO96_032171 [Rhipicephalus appendiculatus]